MASEIAQLQQFLNYTNDTLPLSATNTISIRIFHLLSFISFYYVGVFFPFGIIFNVLLLIVFGISPLGTTKTTRVYYLAMASGEIGTVIFKEVWNFWASIGVPFVMKGFNPLGPLNGIWKESPEWMCGLQVFLWYSNEMFANYTFLLFELERVVAIYTPLRARYLFTKRRTVVLV